MIILHKQIIKNRYLIIAYLFELFLGVVVGVPLKIILSLRGEMQKRKKNVTRWYKKFKSDAFIKY